MKKKLLNLKNNDAKIITFINTKQMSYSIHWPSFILYLKMTCIPCYIVIYKHEIQIAAYGFQLEDRNMSQIKSVRLIID